MTRKKYKTGVKSYQSGGASASHEGPGMIFGGERFTAAESKQLDDICRTRGVSMTEAVRILRAATSTGC